MICVGPGKSGLQASKVGKVRACLGCFLIHDICPLAFPSCRQTIPTPCLLWQRLYRSRSGRPMKWHAAPSGKGGGFLQESAGEFLLRFLSSYHCRLHYFGACWAAAWQPKGWDPLGIPVHPSISWLISPGKPRKRHRRLGAWGSRGKAMLAMAAGRVKGTPT